MGGVRQGVGEGRNLRWPEESLVPFHSFPDLPLAPNTSTGHKATRAVEKRGRFMRARGHRDTRRVIKSANDTMRMRSPECPRQNDTKVQCNAMCPQRRRYSGITTFASS